MSFVIIMNGHETEFEQTLTFVATPSGADRGFCTERYSLCINVSNTNRHSIMKRFLWFAAVAAVCVSCGGKKSGYVIEGKIAEGRMDLEGKYVYMIPYGSDGAATDSALIEKNTFKLQGDPNGERLYALYVKGDGDEMMSRVGEAPFSTVFLLQKGTLQAVLDSFSYVTGTPENDGFKDIRSTLVDGQKRFMALVNEMKEGEEEAMKEKAAQLESEMMGKVKAYIEANPNKLTTAKLLADFQFALDEQVQEAALAKADSAFMNIPGIKEIAEHLQVMKKVAVGQKFTDFEMPDMKGEVHKLSDYVGKGNVTLVDFWASWCGPCMQEMPNLKKAYEKYHKKGFEIVGISLDSDKAAWEAAVKDKQLNWIHLSDLNAWQSAGGALYGVRSIPNTFLMDKDGKIVGHNLSGEELEKKLDELMAEK